MRRILPLLPLLLCAGGCLHDDDASDEAAVEVITIDRIEVSGSSSEAATVTVAGKADEDAKAQTFAVSFTPGADGIAADPGSGTAWNIDLELAVTDTTGNNTTEALMLTVE